MEETQDQFSMKCPLFRENLWLREFGEVFYAKCPTPLCNVKISPFNFDVGHITAASKGGKVTFENCRPICARCNRCNGTRNMDEFFERTNAMERYLYDDQPYEVECIKDSKKCKGKTFYLIKWEGFNEKYNTWEPKDNLEYPPSEYMWETEKRVLRSNSKNV
jgi:hypothetical protein